MKNKQKKISYYFDFSEVLNYFFRKNDPNKKSNFSLKAMHTVNKLSILIFLIGVMVIIVRRIFSWQEVFFFIVIFLALSCQINEKSEKRYNYLALGDSYTIAESLNLIDSYPHQLKNQLKKIDSVNIIAKTGWTTGELIDTLKALNINNKYDYVSLLIGVNNQYREYDISIFEKEFEYLLNLAIQYVNDRSKVFVISIPDYGVTPFGFKNRDKIYKEIDQYNLIKRKIVEKYNIRFYDVTDISREAKEKKYLIAEDSLHPSREMYSLWVDRILNDFDR